MNRLAVPVLVVTTFGFAPFILKVTKLVPVIVGLAIVRVPVDAPKLILVAEPPIVIDVCVESLSTALEVNTGMLLTL